MRHVLAFLDTTASLLLFSSGQRGVYTTSSGLQTAYLSGKSKYMTSNDNNEIVSIINMYNVCMSSRHRVKHFRNIISNTQ